MQDYNQEFNKYANPLGAGASLWARFSPYISRLASLFSKTAPKLSRAAQDAKKIKDIYPKLSKIPTNKDIAKSVAYNSLWVVPAANEASKYIDAGIKDFANTYEGAKAIAEFNKEFEKATGHKPSTSETATYIAKLQQRNQELEAAAAGNKKQTSETVTPSQSKSDQFEIGKLFDISSPYAKYYTLPTAAGATLGGLLYGGKGSAIGGVGGLILGTLAKMLSDGPVQTTTRSETKFGPPTGSTPSLNYNTTK